MTFRIPSHTPETPKLAMELARLPWQQRLSASPAAASPSSDPAGQPRRFPAAASAPPWHGRAPAPPERGLTPALSPPFPPPGSPGGPRTPRTARRRRGSAGGRQRPAPAAPGGSGQRREGAGCANMAGREREQLRFPGAPSRPSGTARPGPTGRAAAGLARPGPARGAVLWDSSVGEERKC